MPSLLEIGSTDAVQFLYSRRTIVLVEGPGDKNAFEKIVGPGYEADIEFRVAPTAAGQGGCRAVRDRVPEMRATNSKIFGLLDGEVAASVAATATLLDCTDTMFTVNGQDGLIFLGVHELENIYLQWSDVPAILADHTTAARMHLHPAPAIKQTLDGLISRFARASLYKYTSAHFHRLGRMRNILSARIFGQGSFKTIRPIVVTAVTSGNGVTWPDFVTELTNVRQAARTSYRRANSDPARRSWLLRIADGKELLHRLRQIHGNIGDSVEGSLLRGVCRSEYPEQFRTALFDLTGTVPSTFAP